MHRRIFRIILILLVTLSPFLCAQTDLQQQTSPIIIRPELRESGSRNRFLPSCTVQRPRIALVLSGGGARGIAAIGVLRVLEENNIPIDLIVGTSMGSVIGGLYAMGYSPQQLQRMIDTTNWEDLLSYTDEARRRDMFLDQKIARDKSIIVLRFDGLTPVIPEAFSTGQRLTNYLNILTIQALYKPEPSFDDLRIPFRAVTTDLVTGKRVVLERGDVTEALRASLSVPLPFSSVARDSMQLLDGGLIDNLPVDVAIAQQADIIVAVDMVSPLRSKSQLNAPWEIADQITTIMMQEATKAAREKAHVVITPKLDDHLSSDFTDLDSIIVTGEQAAEESLPGLKRIIDARIFEHYQTESALRYEQPRFSWTGELSPKYQDSLQMYEKRGWATKMDLQRLVNEIHQEGDCATVEGLIEQRNDSTFVKFSLVPTLFLTRINISGNNLFPADTLLSIFRPMYNQHLNVKRMTQGLESLISIYRKSGYSLARVLEVRCDSITHHATIVLDEGVVSRTDIDGTIKTRDWVLRRELPWRESDLLTQTKVSEGISNLYGTSLFEQIRLSVHHEGDSSRGNIVTIHAQERSTELIRFGLRIDNERNIQPSIDIRDENLFGTSAEAGILIGGGTRNQSYIAEIKATRIFNSYLTFNLKGYSLIRDINHFRNVPSEGNNISRERDGEYREVRNGGIASFGTQLERLGSVTIEGRLEKHKVYNIFNSTIKNEEYNISSVRFGTKVDTQDKLPYPTDGLVMNFSYESALVKLIDAVGFTKMSFSYERYQSLLKNHTLHPRFTIGVADETLPLSEQFSLGGRQNFFGYRDEDTRGRQLLVASLEYQYKLPFSLFFDTYFLARYDFGRVWDKTEEMRLKDFKHGIGFTIGLDTPIGPAEFSLGRSFSFVNSSWYFGPFVVYFNVGYAITGSQGSQ